MELDPVPRTATLLPAQSIEVSQLALCESTPLYVEMPSMAGPENIVVSAPLLVEYFHTEVV